MNKFVRYMVIIFAVIVCTAFIIYAGNLTDNPEDSSSQSSEEMNESPITEDSKDKEDIKTEEGQSSELTDEKHSHQAIEYWLFDENIHWKECVCGETLESDLHEYTISTQKDENSYFKKCFCGYQVKIPNVEITQTQRLHLDTLVKDGVAMVNENQVVSVTLDKEIARLMFVRYKGSNLTATYSGQSIDIPASEFCFDYGRAQLEILTDDTHYDLPVLLITKQIQNKDELDSAAILSKACEREQYRYGGYFTLSANISYEGEWRGGIATQITPTDLQTGRAGFCGVFDGQGYAVYGLNQNSNRIYNAFIGVLCGGVIQNIKFTRASLLYNGGLVCAAGFGVVENVCVEYQSFGCETDAEQYFGTFFGMWATENSVVKNCIVDCRNAQVYINRNGYLLASMLNQASEMVGVLQDVYTLGAPLMQKLVAKPGEREWSFGVFTGANVADWDTNYWQIDGENICFKDK